MCCRIAFTGPIFSRNEMKTAIPPNGVTARCVSRRINRSSDNRALISRGTGLSVAFDSIPLLSQILGANLGLNFEFQVKPTATGGHIVHDEARMLLEPSLNLDSAVGAVVVDDQMERRVAGKLPVDASKKLQEFLMPVSLVTVPDDFALKHIQCGEKRRCPISLVVMSHRSAPAFLQWQAGLSAV